MAQLESLEARMASIEVSLSSSNTPRRRKGTSLGGGSISARASPRPPTIDPLPVKELRTALQDREAVIQSLRQQLGLGKLPRPQGTPIDESERPAAEQRLQRLKSDAENKRIAIRNLKAALEKVDVTDNIDVRIRQAELEYALGREELQMLSLVEEARALQSRMDKIKPEVNTLFSTIQSGTSLCLQAVQATVGRWAACTKPNSAGMWVEWALDGEGLYRGDRILEVNGMIITCKTREDLHKMLGVSGKCQLVVIRKRSAQQHQLVQSQEDNQRLQHRISYLEEQVNELLATKESSPVLNGRAGGTHITSISISSPQPPSTPQPMADKPQIFQRGNFVTTIIGGKPMENPPSSQKSHVTKTIIKDGHQQQSNGRLTSANGGHGNFGSDHLNGQSRSMSASKISINSDTTHLKQRERHYRDKELRRLEEHKREREAGRHHHQPQHYANGNGNINGHNGSASNNNNSSKNQNQNEMNGQSNGYHTQSTPRMNGGQRYSEGGITGLHHYNGFASYARSVEQLNYTNSTSERRKDERSTSDHHHHNGNHSQHHQQHTNPAHHSHTPASGGGRPPKNSSDMRSVKSLDFDSDAGDRKRDIDYTSEPVAQHRVRPTPPKKPLRLSLQRAQSLQTVEVNIAEQDRKRAMKRTHKGKSSEMLQYIENNVPLHTASLGRNNLI